MMIGVLKSRSKDHVYNYNNISVYSKVQNFLSSVHAFLERYW